MRSLTMLAALLMAVILGTPVRADHRYQQYRHQHHQPGHHSHAYSYPSVARHGGGIGWYPRPVYGFGHPYYYGVSVAGPIHPLAGRVPCHPCRHPVAPRIIVEECGPQIIHLPKQAPVFVP